MGINIRGIEINDKSDIEDILSAFSILSSEIEILKNELSEQLIDYNNIRDDLKDDYDKRKELLLAISNLQTQAKELLNYSKNISEQNKTYYQNVKLSLEKELASLKNIISETINNVDLNQFEKQVENLFRNKIDNLSFETEKLSANNTKLRKINEELKYSINRVGSDIKNSISEFNSIAKLVNYAGLSFTFFAGIAIGISIFAIFGFSTLKEKMFKDEMDAIFAYQVKKSELEEVYKNSKGLQRFLNDNGINVSYGFYNGTDIPFLRFKIKQIKPNTKEVSTNFDRNGNRFIGFKTNLKK